MAEGLTPAVRGAGEPGHGEGVSQSPARFLLVPAGPGPLWQLVEAPGVLGSKDTHQEEKPRYQQGDAGGAPLGTPALDRPLGPSKSPASGSGPSGHKTHFGVCQTSHYRVTFRT